MFIFYICSRNNRRMRAINCRHHEGGSGPARMTDISFLMSKAAATSSNIIASIIFSKHSINLPLLSCAALHRRGNISGVWQ